VVWTPYSKGGIMCQKHTNGKFRDDSTVRAIHLFPYILKKEWKLWKSYFKGMKHFKIIILKPNLYRKIFEIILIVQVTENNCHKNTIFLKSYVASIK
jgi:hypothetical protein